MKTRMPLKWTLSSMTMAAALTLAAAPNSYALMDGDLRAGFATDAGALAVGGGVLMDLDNSTRWYFNPNLEASFVEDDSRVSLNGDFHYDFASENATSFYAGAGPALLLGDNNEFGLNLLGGITGLSGSVRPFGQLKGVIADHAELMLMGGIRF